MPTNKDRMFDKGIIYKLYCYQNSMYYWGSTGNTLRQRKHSHCSRSPKLSSSLGEWMRDIGTGNVLIREVITFDNISRKELLQKEDHYICSSREDPNCLNCHRSFVTIEEKYEQKRAYDKEHREDNKARAKNWYENNKDKRKITDKVYQELHKDEIIIKQKEYYENNKEHLQKYKAKWAVDNRERLYKRNKDLKKYCTCCDKYMNPVTVASHWRTLSHIKNFIEY